MAFDKSIFYRFFLNIIFFIDLVDFFFRFVPKQMKGKFWFRTKINHQKSSELKRSGHLTCQSAFRFLLDRHLSNELTLKAGWFLRVSVSLACNAQVDSIWP